MHHEMLGSWDRDRRSAAGPGSDRDHPRQRADLGQPPRHPAAPAPPTAGQVTATPHPRHHHPGPPAHQPRGQPPPHHHRPRHHRPPRPRRRLDRHPHPPRRAHHHRRRAPRHLHHPIPLERRRHPQTLTLPPEAHAHIDHTPHPHTPWLGHTLAAPGHPAWLLDETVPPPACDPRPAPTPLAPLRALTQTLTDPHGNTTGIRIPPPTTHPPAPPPAPRTPRTPRLRHHRARHPLRPAPGPANHPITPEHLALLLADHGLADRPVLLTTPHHSPHTLHPTRPPPRPLLHQPILTTEHTENPSGQVVSVTKDAAGF